MAKNAKRKIDKKTGVMTITPSMKYKMDKDEVQNFLHMKRKGSNVGKNAKQYKRREKYQGKDKY